METKNKKTPISGLNSGLGSNRSIGNWFSRSIGLDNLFDCIAFVVVLAVIYVLTWMMFSLVAGGGAG